MIVIVETLDGSFFDGSVHPFDLAVGPGMLHLCQAMLDAVLVTNPTKDMAQSVLVTGPVGELNAVVG